MDLIKNMQLRSGGKDKDMDLLSLSQAEESGGGDSFKAEVDAQQFLEAMDMDPSQIQSHSHLESQR